MALNILNLSFKLSFIGSHVQMMSMISKLSYRYPNILFTHIKAFLELSKKCWSLCSCNGPGQLCGDLLNRRCVFSHSLGMGSLEVGEG